ncbi:MAG: RNA polymerase sigma factor [Chloroflexi bacterium]|nr:RNA polymerase sigma factor [Chloroflexota bacterium]
MSDFPSLATPQAHFATASVQSDLSALVIALFDEHHVAIFGYLYRLTGNDRELAEELTQQTFLKVFEARGKLPTITNHRAWVYRIATNAANNALKRRRRFQWLSWDKADELSPSQNETMAQVEEQVAVAQALAALSPKQRAPLLLYDHLGFSVKETAEALQISESAVKNRLVRARTAFRKAYQQEAAS